MKEIAQADQAKKSDAAGDAAVEMVTNISPNELLDKIDRMSTAAEITAEQITKIAADESPKRAAVSGHNAVLIAVIAIVVALLIYVATEAKFWDQVVAPLYERLAHIHHVTSGTKRN